MRIDRMDKLDRINFYTAMHSNLVKWWTFNMVDPEDLIEEAGEDEDPSALYDGAGDDYDADAMAEELLADALGADADTAFPITDSIGYGLGSGVPDAESAFSEEAGMDPEAAAAALEIFNRLQAEAAADEAAKQAEIEAAKAMAASNFG